MRLFTGHPDAMPFKILPVWQNGIPQSMHRDPCVLSSCSEKWPWNSSQSCTRSRHWRATGRSLEYSMNPVALPLLVCILEKMDYRAPHLLSRQARHGAGVLLEGRPPHTFVCHSRFSSLTL